VRPGVRAFQLALLLALYVSPGLVPPARADVVDRVVLRVNDRIATLLDYERRRAELTSQLATMNLDDERRAEALALLGSRLFRDMLEELLLLSRADQLRIQPSEEEVDRAVRQVRQDFGIATDDDFAAALSREGLSLAEFREQVRGQLRIREVIAREVTAEVKLEDDDLRRAYRAAQDAFRLPERFRIHELIVLEAEQVDLDGLRAIALEIQAEIEAGRLFEELAAEYAERGLTSGLVDLGWVEAGELDADLEAAVAGLSPGDVSDPVPGRGGLHILKLLEHEESRVRAFAEVAQELEARERQRLHGEKVTEYMRKLEEAAFVRAEPPADAAGFRTVAGSRGQQDPFAGFEPVAGQGPSELGELPVEPPVTEPELTVPESRLEPETVEPPPGGGALR
jgi:peptidyl-prolyl cis-trans isomerase SurA